MKSFLHQQHFLRIVDLGQLDLDDFIHRCLTNATHEGSFNREFAVATIDQYAELHAPRAAMRKQRVHGCADGTPGE